MVLASHNVQTRLHFCDLQLQPFQISLVTVDNTICCFRPIKLCLVLFNTLGPSNYNKLPFTMVSQIFLTSSVSALIETLLEESLASDAHI